MFSKPREELFRLNNQKITLKEIYDVFLKNMTLARDFLDLAELKEFRTKLREIRPLAILRDEYGPIRELIKSYSNNLYKVGLPQTIVFAVSCLETFLRKSYEILKGQPFSDDKRPNFLNLQKVREYYGELIKRDPLNRDEDLLIKVDAVIEKRNIIVHRAGIIDERAYKKFEKANICEGKVGDELKLDVDKVKQDISFLEKFAKVIYENIKDVEKK